MEALDRRQFIQLVGLSGIPLMVGFPNTSWSQTSQASPSYIAQDYSKLLGMQGFSDALLKNHFALYQGYVANTNRLIETLSQMAKAEKIGTPEYAELKRRLGWEFNGMRLHEYYFENLGGKEGIDKSGRLFAKISEDFGNYETWERDFRATAGMRGIGWAILYQDPMNGRLFNLWINEHEGGHLSGGIPILILDVFEHAFMIDYGLRRADYIAAFIKNTDWRAVETRLK